MPELAKKFADVNTWVFDLDNTLYPADSQVFGQIAEKIAQYVQEITGKDSAEAHKIQHGYYLEYGTTLNGLMLKHDVDPEHYLEFVHDIDHSTLQHNGRLKQALEQLPGRRFILTNGTRKHAQNITERLGISGLFDGVFGISEAQYIPKPKEETYQMFLDSHNIDPAGAAMFEDLPKNLVVPKKLGMETVLVLPESSGGGPQAFAQIAGEHAAHVDHFTSNLDGFLEDLMLGDSATDEPAESLR
ncbi:pyrimidine 5'-nucleotidase [Polycladidibacter hongkongensis]|uniref:pyrimidine 5'-nucleotidase n=1 Tax=Polycladidibacter hongkongensis TaxID=1647556 RepID=UPI00082FAE29|nr:pyrimidine 5'-nucleotidase [Pseudovibrio hongkongensis]